MPPSWPSAAWERGLQVVRSFDLIQPGPDACRCPHHGTPGCTCQYSVLLVYPTRRASGGDDGTQPKVGHPVWSCSDPNAPPEGDLVNRILASCRDTSTHSSGLPSAVTPPEDP